MLGKVEICGVNTAKLPVLKGEETRRLLEKARSGSEDARERLISGNLRLVLSVVQKFSNRGESMDDLFQVGCIGLIKAIDCFDLNQNVQFSTYGVPMITGCRNTFYKIFLIFTVDKYQVFSCSNKKLFSFRCTSIVPSLYIITRSISS